MRMRPLSVSSSLPSNCDDDDAAKWLKMDGSAGVELGGLVGSGRGKTGKPGISFRADDFFPIGWVLVLLADLLRQTSPSLLLS